MSEPFVGEIKQFGFNFNPRGYLMAAGQLLPVSQNQALFALIGTFFGGNGTSNFQLPNMCGRVAIGQGQLAGTSIVYDLGEAAGTPAVTLLTANLPPHTHTVNYTAPTLGNITAQTTINAYTRPTARTDNPTGALLSVGQDAVSSNTVNMYATAGNNATLASGAATTAVNVNMSGGNVSLNVTGSGMPVATMPPYVAITYCIALVGVFPTRS